MSLRSQPQPQPVVKADGKKGMTAQGHCQSRAQAGRFILKEKTK
jgi:hypothetical protein